MCVAHVCQLGLDIKILHLQIHMHLSVKKFKTLDKLLDKSANLCKLHSYLYVTFFKKDSYLNG